MTENTTGKSTNELLMRVLQVESPELFDGSDDQPVRVVGYDYSPFCVCETCGDDPEMLTIAFETKSGERYSQKVTFQVGRVVEINPPCPGNPAIRRQLCHSARDGTCRNSRASADCSTRLRP